MLTFVSTPYSTLTISYSYSFTEAVFSLHCLFANCVVTCCRELCVWPEHLRLCGGLGRAQLRDHVFRQHRPCHAHSVPVHHHGGMDCYFILGRFKAANKGTSKQQTSLCMSSWTNSCEAHLLDVLYSCHHLQFAKALLPCYKCRG